MTGRSLGSSLEKVLKAARRKGVKKQETAASFKESPEEN